MSVGSSDRKTPVDYGVQIRFINELYDSGGGHPGGPRGSSKSPSNVPASKYGVAVRVQGIAGQPYVVLKEGDKGDSYGVQLRTQPHDLSYTQAYNSLPRRRDQAGAPNQSVSTGEGNIRRAHSYGSLLEREPGEDFREKLRRPPGDGRSGSYGNLDGGIGTGAEGVESRCTTSRGNNWSGLAPAGLNASVGNDDGRRVKQYSSRESSRDPFPGVCVPEEPAVIVDTNSLAPINRLISKFDGSSSGGQTRGRTGARERLSSEDRKRSRSLDARDGVLENSAPPSVSAPTPKRYISPQSSSTSSASSLGRDSGSVAKGTALSASPSAFSQSEGQFVSRETPLASQTEAQVTPDLLMDQSQSSELMSEEERTKLTIYSILRQGTNERDSAIKRKVNLVFDKIKGAKTNETFSESAAWRTEKMDLERRLAELQSALLEERRSSQMGCTDQTLKAELEDCLDENLQLQELLDRQKAELHQTHTELTQLRMDRESAESHARDLEDQLAGLQEELRRETNGQAQTDLLQTELMSVRAELAEGAALRQRQDEVIRQRERELTALKGALKDEVATHDLEIETIRKQYNQDMERLRNSMEQVSQSQLGIETERQRVNATVRSLQQQLEDCREDGGHWREQFQSTREDLRNTKQELLQVRLDKEESEEELKELRERLNSMKEQMPDPSYTSSLTQALESCRSQLKQTQSELEKQRVESDKKRMEILSLKKTNQEREEEQKYEMGRLKEQSRKDKEELMKALAKAKQLPDPSEVQEQQQQLREARGEVERLQESLACAEQEVQTQKERLRSLQAELQSRRDTEQEVTDSNARLKEKVARLEVQLQANVSQSSEAEQALEKENRTLRSQLEESQRRAARLGQDHEELGSRLEERDQEREALRKGITELEEQKRQLERALAKINKEMDHLSAESQMSAQALHSQLEESRERGRKELQEAQRQAKERLADVERLQGTLRTLQEEVSRLKKELLVCTEERDNAQLEQELLTNRLKHLDSELEAQRGSHTDRTREIRSLEDKIKHLGLELEEEKSSVELLTDRITRGRDQIDQLRSELMQERSSKQDLELDKNALERQMKDLKSRLADMEGQSRSSAGVSQLESKVQELEERLHSEEREKNNIQSSQRRLERKLKELNITLDEERQQQTEQRDQLALRVKALKRQVDESEEEVERLEGLRRKAVRDMEEQQELKEALQTRVTALEAELKRKMQQSRRPALDSALSSEEDDDEDGLCDPSRITSILTEGNLQTSSC